MNISFIVLTYNQEHYIKECLFSLYYQQEKYNYNRHNKVQIIIADDASSDNTIAIINNWVERYKDLFDDVQVLTSRYNKGTCGNYLSGLSKADGDYLKIVAGDDMLPDRSIDKIVKCLDEYDIVYGLPYTFSELKNNDAAMQLRQLEKFHVHNLSEVNDSYYDRIHRSCFLPAVSTYVSKDLLQDTYVIDRIKSFKYIEDYTQFLAFSEIKDVKVLYIPDILHLYRRTNNSAYIIRKEEVFQEFLKVYEYALDTCNRFFDKILIKNRIYCIKYRKSSYYNLEAYYKNLTWLLQRKKYPFKITLSDLEKCETYIQRIKTLASCATNG